MIHSLEHYKTIGFRVFLIICSFVASCTMLFCCFCFVGFGSIVYLRSVHALVMNVCQQPLLEKTSTSGSTVKQYPAHGDRRLILHRAYDIIVMVWCFASTSPIVSFGSL
jgi:hypothetical protein